MGEHARTCMHFVSIPTRVCYILLHMLILLVVVFSDQYFFLNFCLDSGSLKQGHGLQTSWLETCMHGIYFVYSYEAMFDILVPNELTSR